MKIINGKVKLENNDHKVGNFVFTMEKGHVKVQDINTTFSHRVTLASAKGAMLATLIKEEMDVALQNYAIVMYNVLGVVPDMQFLSDVNKLTVECSERHKDVYGIGEPLSDEEDKKVLEDTKEFMEAAETVKKNIEEYGD